jgi:hypothetical protein
MGLAVSAPMQRNSVTGSHIPVAALQAVRPVQAA